MDSNNSTKVNKCNESRSIVKKCISNYTHLVPIQSIFVEAIESLEDKFLMEAVCKTSINLLCSRMKYEEYMKKVKSYATDKTSIPRSLRVKIKLAPSESEVMRKIEFQTLEDETAAHIETFQKNIKNVYRKVKELDRTHAGAIHAINYFKEIKIMVEMKAIYEVNTTDERTRDLVADYNNGKALSAVAWKSIFRKAEANEMDDQNKPFNWLVEAANYVNLSNKIFEAKILKDYDMSLVQDILTKEEYKVKELKDVIKQIEDFICLYVPKYTTGILQQYKLQSNRDTAIALSLSVLESNKTRDMTEIVSKAIAEEGTMNAKAMTDLINKRVNEGLDKAMKKLKRSEAKNSTGGKGEATTNAVANNKSNKSTPIKTTTPTKSRNQKRKESNPTLKPSSLRKKSKKSTSPHSQINPRKPKKTKFFEDIVWKRSEQGKEKGNLEEQHKDA